MKLNFKNFFTNNYIREMMHQEESKEILYKVHNLTTSTENLNFLVLTIINILLLGSSDKHAICNDNMLPIDNVNINIVV